MSRVLQQDIEGKTRNPIGPIRWMSPESIGQQVYSKKSDVWMFGIVVGDLYGTSSWCPWIDPSWDRTKAIHSE
jgi:serine/threonine protein kinase